MRNSERLSSTYKWQTKRKQFIPNGKQERERERERGLTDGSKYKENKR